ncbi:hypothetical protein GE09DRAFT_409711 [Coniochaeta sp. 2T2.1]|nr:hypothetical protein GE09DRAFT_409711 [Coniochaeta sp. 2T2.1]
MTGPQHRPSRPQHHHYRSRPSTPRRGSTASFSSDDDITPAPLQKQQTRQTQPTHQTTSPSSSTSTPSPSLSPQRHHRSQRPTSWRSSEHYISPLVPPTDEETDATALWHTMLAIQRELGCYNSARMRAAVESGGEGPVPSKTCLDLLNDSIRHLPEDELREIDDFLSTTTHQFEHFWERRWGFGGRRWSSRRSSASS